MKFQFKKVPVDENGKAYDSLEAFQVAELGKLLADGATGISADSIVDLKDEVIEILSLTMDARPGARGQKRPRKPKADPQIKVA